MKTIGIDIDGVLRNFHKQLLLVARILNPNLKVTNNFSDYWLRDAIDLSKEQLRQICHHTHPHQVFVEAPAYESNVLFLSKMMQHLEGVEFVAITAAGGYNNEHLTYKWLAKHELNFRRVIFCPGNKKAKENIDILVDDSSENYNAWKLKRGPEDFLIMDRPWNQDCKATRIPHLGALFTEDYCMAGDCLKNHKLNKAYQLIF